MCIKACASINNYQLVRLFIRKINRRRALVPLRDQDGESAELRELGRKTARLRQHLAVVCPPPLPGPAHSCVCL